MTAAGGDGAVVAAAAGAPTINPKKGSSSMQRRATADKIIEEFAFLKAAAQEPRRPSFRSAAV